MAPRRKIFPTSIVLGVTVALAPSATSAQSPEANADKILTTLSQWNGVLQAHGIVLERDGEDCPRVAWRGDASDIIVNVLVHDGSVAEASILATSGGTSSALSIADSVLNDSTATAIVEARARANEPTFSREVIDGVVVSVLAGRASTPSAVVALDLSYPSAGPTIYPENPTSTQQARCIAREALYRLEAIHERVLDRMTRTGSKRDVQRSIQAYRRWALKQAALLRNAELSGISLDADLTAYGHDLSTLLEALPTSVPSELGDALNVLNVVAELLTREYTWDTSTSLPGS